MTAAPALPFPTGIAPLLSQKAPPPPEPLPGLRQDLDVLPAPREKNGAPSWTLFDPVRNLFFRIGWLEFEMLSRWGEGTAPALAERLNRETRFEVEATDVEVFVKHLRDSQLVATEAGRSWKHFAEAEKRKKHGPFKWMLHHYLFFRVPLVRPDSALVTIERLLRFMFTPGFVAVMVAALLVGLYLVGRQWDVFAARLHSLTTLQTLPWFFAALTFAKLFHELGHAVVAKRHGARVPAAGLAFMVFWPMLYTDTTDAWRITSRHARMAIDGAGVAAELILAVVALLVWSFLSDGPVRDAALMIATVTWVTTLAVNLSPFMRFDGYYLLADYVDIPNLQSRAFETTRWWIRATFLGIADEPPEPFSDKRRRWLIAYSLIVWIYRLILFTGIAIVVYHFFIKLVGILLFLVEIFWFILGPIMKELKIWWDRRADMQVSRGGVAVACVIGVALIAFVWPWGGRIEAPAMARAASFVRLFPTASARIEKVLVTEGSRVNAGDMLFVLASPDIDSRVAIARAKIEESQREAAASSFNQEAAERLGVLAGEIATSRREISAQEELRERLTIRAPIAGVIRNLPTDIRPGLWVGEDAFLGLLTDSGAGTVVAYVDEADIKRVAPGAEARFYAGRPDAPRILAKVVDVERVGVHSLDDRDLSVQRGGSIEVQRANSQQSQRPIQGLYKVRLAIDQTASPIAQSSRGVVQIAAEPQSVATRVWRATASVLIRESGF